MERLNTYQANILNFENLSRRCTIILIFSWILMSVALPVFSQAPQIIVSEPLSYSVARPLLHVKAKAIAATDHCSLTIYMGNTYLLRVYDMTKKRVLGSLKLIKQ